MQRTRLWVWALWTVSAVGCAADKEMPAVEPTLSHEFPLLTVEARAEIPNQCMSWTLNNDEPIWVNTVASSNEGAFHHSNWVYVPDTAYEGPDGNWPCDERGFDQVGAAAMGGVFFAQSTQSRTDEQRFPDGVAFQVPARARVIGQVHLLNLRNEDVDTQIRFDVFGVSEDEIDVRLRSMAFTNLALDVAPQAVTHARMDCSTPDPTFDVYYVLPHYHELGKTMRVSVVGGPDDGVEIFHSTAAYGDPLGGTLSPAISVHDATHLRVTCEYDNPRDVSVGYGIGDQEMCVVLVYSDSEVQSGGAAIANGNAEFVDGTYVTDAPCISLSL